jgi:hypothetical protein
MSHDDHAYSVEERIHGGTVWVAIRARGAVWSWLTPEEAALIGRQWAARYAAPRAKPRLAAISERSSPTGRAPGARAPRLTAKG